MNQNGSKDLSSYCRGLELTLILSQSLMPKSEFGSSGAEIEK